MPSWPEPYHGMHNRTRDNTPDGLIPGGIRPGDMGVRAPARSLRATHPVWASLPAACDPDPPIRAGRRSVTSGCQLEPTDRYGSVAGFWTAVTGAGWAI